MSKEVGLGAGDLRGQLLSWGAVNDMADIAGAFLWLLDTRPRAFQRDEFDDGHFTGSAWLVSADGERALLTHHRALRLWVQPGGHADGDADMGRVALREAIEESGLSGLVLVEGIFDIDRHVIPARGDTPAHHHYDVRFVVRATDDERHVVSEESLDLAWRPVTQLAEDATVDASVRRMARRWLARPR